MYIPASFQIEDMEVNYEIIEKHSFATLVSQHEGIPCATHLPLILDRENKCLYGHFARPNPQWKDIERQEVLVTFQGPHCYISPSWYETPTAVPTWNYVAVHVYGQVEFVDGEELMKSLREMVLKYEMPSSSYQLDQVDRDYLANMSRGIQGFKIKMTRMEGKAKLSQNHPIERQERVIRQLEQINRENEQEIAGWMRGNIE